MQQQQQPQIDLRNTEQVFNSEGGVLFKQGIILRKVSKFVTGTPDDMLMTVPVFYDPTNGKILENAVPPAIKEELTEYFSNKEESGDEN